MSEKSETYIVKSIDLSLLFFERRCQPVCTEMSCAGFVELFMSTSRNGAMSRNPTLSLSLDNRRLPEAMKSYDNDTRHNNFSFRTSP